MALASWSASAECASHRLGAGFRLLERLCRLGDLGLSFYPTLLDRLSHRPTGLLKANLLVDQVQPWPPASAPW